MKIKGLFTGQDASEAKQAVCLFKKESITMQIFSKVVKNGTVCKVCYFYRVNVHV